MADEDGGLKKIGRPLKLVDDERTLQTLGGLAKIQCTTKEAAAVLSVSEVTFIDFLKRCEKAREVWDNNQQAGRASLRRMQFAAADKGNTAMMIWLGKQYLGQKDMTHNENTIGFTQEFEDFIRGLNERRKTKVIDGSVAGNGRDVGKVPARIRN